MAQLGRPATSAFAPLLESNRTSNLPVAEAFRHLAKCVGFQMVISIVNNGAGSGEIVASLPFISAAQGAWDAIGREDAVNGKTVHGLIKASQSSMTIGNYDNTYPGVNGAFISVSGTYEAA